VNSAQVTVMKTALIIASILLVSGCAHTFYKPGATAQELAADKYECELERANSRTPTGLVGLSLYTDCMHARGYQ
jgi:hypothetical protein